MGSHDFDPTGSQPERPEHERMPDDEIDLTGAVEQPASLIDVIGDAVVEAGEGGEVPDWGARVMARYLANIIGGADSGLHHFAVTANGDHDKMLDELGELWEQYSGDEFVGEIINRLGTYLIATERDARGSKSPAVAEEPDDASLARQAFLELPDVTTETSDADFQESYYRSFPSLEAVAQHVAGSHEVWELLEATGLSHVASPDARLLLSLAHQRWDIVGHQGRFYLFEK